MRPSGPAAIATPCAVVSTDVGAAPGSILVAPVSVAAHRAPSGPLISAFTGAGVVYLVPTPPIRLTVVPFAYQSEFSGPLLRAIGGESTSSEVRSPAVVIRL